MPRVQHGARGSKADSEAISQRLHPRLTERPRLGEAGALIISIPEEEGRERAGSDILNSWRRVIDSGVWCYL
jgi:hypothetical protein